MFSWLEGLFERRFFNRASARGQRLIQLSDSALIAQFVLDNNSDLIFWTDVDGNFLDFNTATCEVLGYSRDELNSMNVRDIDSEITDETHRELLATLEEQRSIVVQTNPIRKDGSSTTLEFTVKRFVIGDRVYLCAFGKEIEMETRFRDRVLESIARCRPLSATLDMIVEMAENTRKGTMGSILLLDDARVLRMGAAAKLSFQYRQQIDGLVPGNAVGSCGTAAFTGKSVIVEDVLSSSLWSKYRDLAEQDGIRACWSEPVFSSSNDVIGTVSMYFREVCPATDVDRALMKSFARIAGIAIERSRETEQLRKNELRYRSLVQSSATTVWTTSPTGGFVSRQESWKEYTGQPWEQHRGFGWREMIHPDDQVRMIESWKVAVETGSNHNSYGRLWHARSNEFRHFEVQSVPVIVDGEIVEWSGCTIDVHDQIIAEESRQQTERHLQTIANSLPICIGQIDNGFQYQFINARYGSFHGMTAEEIQGRTIMEVFGESTFQLVKPHFEVALQGKQVTFEQRDESIDGVSRISETRLVPNRDAEGNVIGVFILTDDVTQRRALEKEVLSVAVQEQRRIGQDVHDGIGQELTGLGMIADAMVQALSRSNVDQVFMARKISDGIKRTLQQAKLLARGLNPVDVSPHGICSALIEMANHVEDLYGIGCVVHCASDFHFGDDQISTNLFRIAQESTTNAAKHGQASVITINLEKNETEVVLSIEDDGCGFESGTANSPGMGLRTMEYRAALIGAEIKFSPGRKGGTCVSCKISIQDSKLSSIRLSKIASY